MSINPKDKTKISGEYTAVDTKMLAERIAKRDSSKSMLATQPAPEQPAPEINAVIKAVEEAAELFYTHEFVDDELAESLRSEGIAVPQSQENLSDEMIAELQAEGSLDASPMTVRSDNLDSLVNASIPSIYPNEVDVNMDDLDKTFIFSKYELQALVKISKDARMTACFTHDCTRNPELTAREWLQSEEKRLEQKHRNDRATRPT